MSDSKNSPDLIAFQVILSGERRYWNRIGAAWANAKGGYAIRLSAFPVDGQIILLPPRENGDDARTENAEA